MILKQDLDNLKAVSKQVKEGTLEHQEIFRNAVNAMSHHHGWKVEQAYRIFFDETKLGRTVFNQLMYGKFPINETKDSKNEKSS